MRTISKVVILDYDDYLDKRVEIISANRKQKYHKLLHMIGTVTRTSSGEVGVAVDGIENEASQYGVFWFKRHELRIMEDTNMEGFKNVAIVNLLDDYNKKDYGFALYDNELGMIQTMDHYPAMVVVNARGKDNRILGIVKEIMPVEEYGKGVTAQVVGVVNMDGYIARVEEENRLKELAKKKAAIEKELEAEINKRKSVEYYEEMAKKYSDNPKLAELVAELKGLGD